MPDDSNAPAGPAGAPPAAPVKKPIHLRVAQACLGGGEEDDTTLVFHPNHGEMALLDKTQLDQLTAAITEKYGNGKFSMENAEQCTFAFEKAKALAAGRVFTNAQMSSISLAMSRLITIGGWNGWG